MKQKMIKRKLLSFLLTLALVLGLVPWISLTAQAEGEKAYAAYDVTTETNKNMSGDDLTALQVTFNARKWYIIEDNSSSATSKTVTLLSADTSFGTSAFDSTSNAYSSSTVRGVLDALTAEGGAFASVKDAIAATDLSDVGVIGVKLYLLSTEEASSLPENVLKAEFNVNRAEITEVDVGKTKEWWLRSPGAVDESSAAFVDGNDGFVTAGGDYVRFAFGVRPALKLDLSKVTFASNTFTFEEVKSVTPKTGNTTTGEVTNGNAISLTKYTGNTFPVSGNYYLAGDLSVDRKSTRLNSSHPTTSRMPSSA